MSGWGALGNCPYSGILCTQGCGCCKDCNKTKDNPFPPDCACGIWRDHRNDKVEEKPAEPVKEFNLCQKTTGCDHRVSKLTVRGTEFVCALDNPRCLWLGKLVEEFHVVKEPSAEEPQKVAICTHTPNSLGCQDINMVEVKPMDGCKEITCDHCGKTGTCLDAYSKPVTGPKYNIPAYSKVIGWEHGVMDLPTREDLDKIIRECRKGSTYYATQLFTLYRFAKSPENEDEAAISITLFNAFHELFG